MFFLVILLLAYNDRDVLCSLGRVLRWDEHSRLGDIEARYDIVLCADW